MFNIVRRAIRAICLAMMGGGWTFAQVTPASGTEVQLGALKDTMIFQSSANGGAGGAPGIFAGTNSQPSIRRAMIAFDVSSIPSHATITNVQLRLVIGQVAGAGGGTVGFPNPTIELHKLLVDWGEASTAASTSQGLGGITPGNPAEDGDSTWNARFFFNSSSSTLWSQPGGQAGVDYATSASASLVQGNDLNDVSLWLSTPALVTDVQGWLGSPSTNDGWMLINANETASQTFRGFYSRNYNPVPTVPGLEDLFPKLFVSYFVVNPDTNGSGFVDISDIQTVASHFLTSGPTGDANQDGLVDVSDIQVIAAHWLQTWPPAGSASGTSVPEPATWALFVAGLVALTLSPLRTPSRPFALAQKPTPSRL